MQKPQYEENYSAFGVQIQGLYSSWDCSSRHAGARSSESSKDLVHYIESPIVGRLHGF